MRTIINVILDESGSMETCRQATISGFNEYVTNLRTQGGTDMLLSLTKFNTEVNRVHTAMPLADVPALSEHTYRPNGMTALYDATASIVHAVEVLLRPGDRVLCVIITDGQENSSKETTRQQIFDLIQSKEKEGNWTFVYLGANQDSWLAGQAMGMAGANTANYASTPVGTQSAYENLSDATVSYNASKARQAKRFWNKDEPAK